MASPLRMGGGLSGRDNLRRSAIKAGKPTSHTTTPSKLGKGKSLAAPSPRKALQVLSDNTKERPASTSKGPSAEKDPEQLVKDLLAKPDSDKAKEKLARIAQLLRGSVGEAGDACTPDGKLSSTQSGSLFTPPATVPAGGATDTRRDSLGTNLTHGSSGNDVSFAGSEVSMDSVQIAAQAEKIEGLIKENMNLQEETQRLAALAEAIVGAPKAREAEEAQLTVDLSVHLAALRAIREGAAGQLAEVGVPLPAAAAAPEGPGIPALVAAVTAESAALAAHVPLLLGALRESQREGERLSAEVEDIMDATRRLVQAEMEGEMQSLRAALDASRAVAAGPPPKPEAEALQQEVLRLRAELDSARAAAPAGRVTDVSALQRENQHLISEVQRQAEEIESLLLSSGAAKSLEQSQEDLAKSRAENYDLACKLRAALAKAQDALKENTELRALTNTQRDRLREYEVQLAAIRAKQDEVTLEVEANKALHSMRGMKADDLSERGKALQQELAYTHAQLKELEDVLFVQEEQLQRAEGEKATQAAAAAEAEADVVAMHNMLSEQLRGIQGVLASTPAKKGAAGRRLEDENEDDLEHCLSGLLDQTVVQSLEEQLSEAHIVIDSERTAAGELQRQLEATAARAADLRGRLSQAQAAAAAATALAGERAAEAQALQADLAKAQSWLEEALQRGEALKAERGTLESKVASLARQLDGRGESATQLEEVLSELASARHETDALRAESEGLRAEGEEKDAAIAGLESEREALMTEAHTGLEMSAELAEMSARLQGHLEALGKMRDVAAANESLRGALSQLTGVAESMDARVRRGYEHAADLDARVTDLLLKLSDVPPVPPSTGGKAGAARRRDKDSPAPAAAAHNARFLRSGLAAVKALSKEVVAALGAQGAQGEARDAIARSGAAIESSSFAFDEGSSEGDVNDLDESVLDRLNAQLGRLGTFGSSPTKAAPGGGGAEAAAAAVQRRATYQRAVDRLKQLKSENKQVWAALEGQVRASDKWASRVAHDSDRIAHLEEELEAAGLVVARLEAKSSDAEGARAELARMASEIAAVQAEWGEAKSRLGAREARIADLESRLGAREAAVMELEARLSARDEDVGRLEHAIMMQHSEQEMKSETARVEAAKLRGDAEHFRREAAELRAELSRREAAHKVLVEREEASRAEAGGAAERAGALEGRVAQLEEEAAAAFQAGLEGARAAAKEREADAAKSRKEIDAAREGAFQARAAADAARADAASAAEAAAAARGEERAARAALSAAEAAATAAADAARAQLEASAAALASSRAELEALRAESARQVAEHQLHEGAFEAQISHLRKQLDTALVALEANRHEVERCEEKEAALERRLEGRVESLAQLEAALGDLEAARKDADGAQRALAAAEAESAALRGRLRDTEAQLAASTAELGSARARAAEAEAAARAKAEELEARARDMDVMETQMISEDEESKLLLASKEGEVKALRFRVEQLESSLVHLESEAGAARPDAEAAPALRARAAQLERLEGALRARAEGAEAALSAETEAAGALRNRVAELEGAEVVLRGRAAEAEAAGALRARVQELEFAEAALRARAEEAEAAGEGGAVRASSLERLEAALRTRAEEAERHLAAREGEAVRARAESMAHAERSEARAAELQMSREEVARLQRDLSSRSEYAAEVQKQALKYAQQVERLTVELSSRPPAAANPKAAAAAATLESRLAEKEAALAAALEEVDRVNGELSAAKAKAKEGAAKLTAEKAAEAEAEKAAEGEKAEAAAKAAEEAAAGARADSARFEVELAALREERNTAAAAGVAARAALQKVEGELASARAALTEAEARAEAAEALAPALEAKAKALEELRAEHDKCLALEDESGVDGAAAEVRRLRREWMGLKQRLEEREEEIKRLQSPSKRGAANAAAQRDAAQKAEEHRAAMAALQSELDAARARASGAAAAAAEAAAAHAARLEEVTTELDSREAQLGALRKECEALRLAGDKARSEVKRLKSALEGASDAMAGAAGEAAGARDLRARLEAATSEAAALKGQLADRERIVELLCEDNKQLNVHLRDLAGRVELESRKAIEAAKMDLEVSMPSPETPGGVRARRALDPLLEGNWNLMKVIEGCVAPNGPPGPTRTAPPPAEGEGAKAGEVEAEGAAVPAPRAPMAPWSAGKSLVGEKPPKSPAPKKRAAPKAGGAGPAKPAAKAGARDKHPAEAAREAGGHGNAASELEEDHELEELEGAAAGGRGGVVVHKAVLHKAKKYKAKAIEAITRVKQLESMLSKSEKSNAVVVNRYEEELTKLQLSVQEMSMELNSTRQQHAESSTALMEVAKRGREELAERTQLKSKVESLVTLIHDIRTTEPPSLDDISCDSAAITVGGAGGSQTGSPGSLCSDAAALEWGAAPAVLCAVPTGLSAGGAGRAGREPASAHKGKAGKGHGGKASGGSARKAKKASSRG